MIELARRAIFMTLILAVGCSSTRTTSVPRASTTEDADIQASIAALEIGQRVKITYLSNSTVEGTVERKEPGQLILRVRKHAKHGYLNQTKLMAIDPTEVRLVAVDLDQGDRDAGRGRGFLILGIVTGLFTLVATALVATIP